MSIVCLRPVLSYIYHIYVADTGVYFAILLLTISLHLVIGRRASIQYVCVHGFRKVLLLLLLSRSLVSDVVVLHLHMKNVLFHFFYCFECFHLEYHIMLAHVMHCAYVCVCMRYALSKWK